MIPSESADEHWEQGVAHYQAGHLPEAITAWQAGLLVDPEHADLHYNLGVALSETGRSDEATAHWQTAVRLRPDFYWPYYGLICAAVKRLEAEKSKAPWYEVRKLCRQALALPHPAHKAYLLRLLGMAEWTLGNRHEGVETMKAAVDADPSNQRGYMNLGRMQRRIGDWRGMCQTAISVGDLSNVDLSEYEPAFARLRLLRIGLPVLIGALIFMRLRRSW